ncbi:MAG: 6-pyruvoyl tetrahydropterin synthase family protein [Asgard group archaeon]|nr:6-pyruvoyl tetrahydropterin synthase family protein [Asgard group archaeon]
MPFEIEYDDPRIGFAAAHFIVDHEKCGRLHGHNYFLRVKISGELNDKHMVLDYGILKDELRKITEPLDHKVLIPSESEGLSITEIDNISIEIITCNKRYLIPKEDAVLIPLSATTSEELAKYFHQILTAIWPNFTITVNVEEAPGASATFTK